VVEIPDDAALPPRWSQWENWPAPTPESAAGVLVMREDDCVMPRQPTHGAEATNSGEHSRTSQNHDTLTTRKAGKRPTRETATSRNPIRW
jgi:hypothetical protein